MNEKIIKDLETAIISGNAELGGKHRQVDMIFSEMFIQKSRHLEKLLAEKYGVSGKAQAITIAVLYLIHELENIKEK